MASNFQRLISEYIDHGGKPDDVECWSSDDLRELIRSAEREIHRRYEMTNRAKVQVAETTG